LRAYNKAELRKETEIRNSQYEKLGKDPDGK
jgi:hypothetical protein